MIKLAIIPLKRLFSGSKMISNDFICKVNSRENEYGKEYCEVEFLRDYVQVFAIMTALCSPTGWAIRKKGI